MDITCYIPHYIPLHYNPRSSSLRPGPRRTSCQQNIYFLPYSQTQSSEITFSLKLEITSFSVAILFTFFPYSFFSLLMHYPLSELRMPLSDFGRILIPEDSRAVM